MKIRWTRHRGLQTFLETDDVRGIRADQAKRLRNILAALMCAPTIEEVSGPPGWRIHQLTGDRLGTWSISVSGNWRITFTLENDEICDLDLEDYH